MNHVTTQTAPAEGTSAQGGGRPPLFVLVAGLALFFLRFGYDYGASDQDELLPFLMHRMDPSLFTQDWFVATQTGDFGVRTFFVWLLHGLSLFLPTWLAVLLLWIATWLLVAGAVYALTRHFTGDRLAASAAVVIALVLTPRWTLGGNDLVHTMMVPSMLGWALALWATYHFLRSRFILAPVMLGVACWFQALVGLQVAAVLILIRLVNVLRKEKAPHTFGSWAMFTALFILWSSPALGPLINQQFAADVPASGGAPDLFYVMASFRLPHHYLPRSFYPYSILRFGLLALLGAAALAVPAFRRRLTHGTFVVRVLALVAVVGAVAFVFTEVVPVLMVAKLQAFKLTVLAKVLLVAVVCGAATFWLPDAARRPFEAVLDRRHWALAAVVLACGGLVYGVVAGEGGYLRERVGPWKRAASSLGDVETWARRSTPHDAIFAIPPSVSSFRTASERTIVVNFKAIPFQDEQLLTWFERLTDVAPIVLPERGGPAIRADLDAAYEDLTPAALQALQRRYRFDFVLRRTPLPDSEAFDALYSNGDWYVYRATGQGAGRG